MCCAVSVDARLHVNVALNRPSYQSSDWTDAYGTHIAEKGNDGNRDVHLSHGSCVHTKKDTNAWWAVDLGVPLLWVHSVKFTNRGDSESTYAVFHVN